MGKSTIITILAILKSYISLPEGMAFVSLPRIAKNVHKNLTVDHGFPH